MENNKNKIVSLEMIFPRIKKRWSAEDIVKKINTNEELKNLFLNIYNETRKEEYKTKDINDFIKDFNSLSDFLRNSKLRKPFTIFFNEILEKTQRRQR